jgi:phosphosulfolactate synthase
VRPQFLELPERPQKPRTTGLTHVLDRGVDLTTARAVLAAGGEFVDLWKIGWGTAYIDRALPEKLDLLAECDVSACFGGTLLELAWCHGRAPEYLDWVGTVGCPCIEVSRGTAQMSVADKHRLISVAAERFIVYAEVGSKSPDDDAGPQEWADEAAGDLAAGAAMIIAEGRESGAVGIYRSTGEVRHDIVDALVSAVGAGSVLFEAPRKAQQAWFVRHLGSNVNLGNIALDEAVAVETLRLGLRSDTMSVAYIPAEPRC